ncbi:MAG: hypothetical protein IPH88_08340 [Bacteroidales bacterium]|nr:hypothetical protein [Bacteroidales bacterium]
MKQVLFIILILTGQLCFANMGTPIREGTLSGSAISSRDIDIVRETIHLKIDKDFKTAFYQIEYHIKTDIAGKQIPLLFLAKDYKGNFTVWVDDQKVKLIDIPEEYKTTAKSPFERFSGTFERAYQEGESETVEISWQKDRGFSYRLNDLKYFETDLSEGEHIVRVEYTADVWTDVSDWIKEYSFRYSLSPAKYWKSFGSLEITIDASDFNSNVTTNLGQASQGNPDSIAVWNFSKLPGDYIQVSSKPKISRFADAMIAIDPFGLTVIFALLISLLHLLGIIKYRRSKPAKRYSWVVISGSVLIPFLILVFYIMSYDFIDSAIGEAAGRFHGYTFLVILLYPLILLIYWGLMWLIDRTIKRKINTAE